MAIYRIPAPDWNSAMRGHPSEPETFEFRQTREGDGALYIIKSHVAFDSRWPWWRRLFANLRGRP